MAGSRAALGSIIEATASGERTRVRNRRALNRLPVSLPVTLIWDEQSHEAIVTDLGMGGGFVECEVQAPFATALVMVVQHRLGELSLPATVRWNGERGMGMQFGLLGARETHAIAELLQRARDENP
jgi:hypothetical protein